MTTFALQATDSHVIPEPATRAKTRLPVILTGALTIAALAFSTTAVPQSPPTLHSSALATLQAVAPDVLAANEGVDTTATSLPATLANGVDLGNGVRIAVSSGLGSAGTVIAPGLMNYGETSPGVTTLVQALPTEGGRILSIISDGAGASALRYSLDLPAGAVASVDPAGAVQILSASGGLISYLGAPWAKDAAGTSLPTSYLVDGSNLTQVVDTTNATFPVVADPSWGTAWKITKCAAVLAANAFVAYKLMKGLKGAWSMYDFAKLLVQGTFAREKLYAIAIGVTGIDTIVSACL